MPRMLSPSSSSGMRRSGTSLNGSLHGSRTSLSSMASSSSRAAEMRSKYIGGSQFSLRRSSLRSDGSMMSAEQQSPGLRRSSLPSGGSMRRSSSSLRRMPSSRGSLRRELSSLVHPEEEEPSSKNATWDFVDNQGSSSFNKNAVFDFVSQASKAPLPSFSKGQSFVTQATSVVSTESDRSSESSLLSSLVQSPTPASDCLTQQSAPAFPAISNNKGDKDDALARFCALQKAYFERPENNNNNSMAFVGAAAPSSNAGPKNFGPQLQGSILHPTGGIRPRIQRTVSLIPQIKEEDHAWGQFVESKCEEDEECDLDLRRTKSLSLVNAGRRYSAGNFARLAPRAARC